MAQAEVVNMKAYQLNVEQSKTVYERCKQHIQVKHCYNNVFEVVTDYMGKFRGGGWKIAYGYVEVMAGLYCRHCFILDNEDMVIDPTIFAWTEPPLQREYLVMTVFDDVDKYLNAIEQDGYMPALDSYLKDDDKQAHEWAKNNGYVLVG